MFQISYADMLTKVDPLRNELKSLEIEAQASRIKVRLLIGHFTVVYLVAKPLIWSEAEGDLVVFTFMTFMHFWC